MWTSPVHAEKSSADARLFRAFIESAHVGLADKTRDGRAPTRLPRSFGGTNPSRCWDVGLGHGQGIVVAPVAVAVAVLDFGMSDHQRTILFQMAMNPRTDTEFRDPILNRMGSQEQSTNLVDHVFPTIEAWETSCFRQELLRMGVEFWLHSVRYSRLESWSTLLLFRSVGSERFTLGQRDLIDLAMASIDWLQPPISNAIRSEAALSLTHRQRTVMLLLLDGQSRKQIAKSLGICKETVGDHVKAIYQEFEVHSAGELAALFLRSH